MLTISFAAVLAAGSSARFITRVSRERIIHILRTLVIKTFPSRNLQRKAIRPTSLSHWQGVHSGHRTATAGIATAVGGPLYCYSEIPDAGVHRVLRALPRTRHISQAFVCQHRRNTHVCWTTAGGEYWEDDAREINRLLNKLIFSSSRWI